MANMEKQASDIGKQVSGAARDVQKNITQGAQQGMDRAREGVQQARGTMSEVSEFISNEAPEYLKHALADIRESAAKAADASKSTINKYPFYSIAGAVAAGAVLGLFLGRSRK